MSKDKKIRRLSHLIEKYHVYHVDGDDLIDFLDRKIKYCTQFKWYKKEVRNANSIQEIKEIVLELNIDKEEYIKIYNERVKNHPKFDKRLNNLKETRDNKGVHVGSGGSNYNDVRYPKKNRSKKVWDTFYKMFPYYAEKDGYKFKKGNKK